MHPEKTYELRISLVEPISEQQAQQLKEDLRAWLIGNGEETFVEGIVDGIYVDPDVDHPERDFYSELGGEKSPLSIFRYDKEYLDALRFKVERAFGKRIQCEDFASDTAEWQEGWKANFKPFCYSNFYIYPPWEPKAAPEGKIALLIEPGMAFGTGLHATTKLCLGRTAMISARVQNRDQKSVWDVGTGTAILAIAAAKLGWGKVYGSDIDPDAVMAAERNGIDNGVNLTIRRGSLPDGDSKLDFIFANILGVVLRSMIPQLAPFLKTGGSLVISGILNEEEAEMNKVATAAGLNLLGSDQLEGWSVMEFIK